MMNVEAGAETNSDSDSGVLNAERAYRTAIILVVGVGIVIRLLLLRYAHATEEDFYITLRYARNIASGQGFTFNPGERVLGTTTPLYTLFLALLFRLHCDPVLGGKLVGILADAIACYGVFRLGRCAGCAGAGLAAAICVCTLPTNLTWATKGMEVGIVAAAATLAWAFWADRHEAASWSAAAVLVLLRIDGVALVALLLAASLVRDRRAPWRGLLVFVLLLAPWIVFALFYFGSPIPASLRAKLIVYGHHAIGPFPRLGSFLQLMLHPAGAVIAAGAIVALCAMIVNVLRSRESPSASALLPTRVRTLGPPALWVVVYYCGMALSTVFLFGWYFVPPTPIYYLIAMVGWQLLLKRVLPGQVVMGRAIVWAACLATVVLGAVFTPTVLRDLRTSQRVEDGLRIPIANWMRTHARRADRVMLEPIGYIGYYSDLRILDTVGLVSPEVLPFWARDVHSPLHEIWTHFQPEWILLRNGERQLLGEEEAAFAPSERLPAHYRLITAWADPDFPGATPSFYLFRRDVVSNRPAQR